MKQRAALLFCLMLLLGGCGARQAPVQPQNQIEIQYESGVYDREAVIESMQVKSVQDGYAVTFRFARADGLPLNQLPCYQLGEIQNPYRLVLSGNFVADSLEDEQVSTGALSCYKCQKDGLTQIYLQTGSAGYFSVQENGDALTVTLSATSQETSQAFYYSMTYDGAAAMAQTAWRLGMTPAMVAGSLVYLSNDAFDSLEAAQEACDRLNGKYALDAALSAVQLGGASFGAASFNSEQLEQIQLLQPVPDDQQDASAYAACWVYGGAYLCPYDDTHALFAVPDGSGSAIWLYGYDGMGEPLENATAAALIERATLCGQTRYLAYSDQNGAVYWYDAVARQASRLVLSDSSDQILQLVWSQDERLYILARVADQRQLYVWDPLSDGTPQRVDLTFEPGAHLASGGGLLLLQDDEDLVRLLSAQGESTGAQYPAHDFALSPDGTQLICLQSGQTDELVCYALDGSAEPFVLAQGQTLQIAACAPDGAYLHYWRTDEEGQRILCTYRFSDKVTTQHGAFSSDFFFSLPAGWVGVVRWTQDQIPVTFRVHLNYG